MGVCVGALVVGVTTGDMEGLYVGLAVGMHGICFSKHPMTFASGIPPWLDTGLGPLKYTHFTCLSMSLST